MTSILRHCMVLVHVELLPASSQQGADHSHLFCVLGKYNRVSNESTFALL